MAKTDLLLTDIVKKNPEKFLQLRQAFGILYDDDGNVAPENKSEAKSLLEQIHKFGIPDLTIKETGLFMEKLYEDLQKGTETITEVQEYKAESNMLTPDELAQFQKEQEEQSRKIKETIAESKEAVEKAIKTKKELYAKTKIQKPDLTSKQQEAAEVIVDEIKKAPTPEEAIKIVQPIIRESIPEEIPDAVVGLTAASIVINVKTNFTPTIQTELAKATSEKPEYSDLAAVLSDQSKSLSELKELSSLTKDVTKLAFGDEGQKVLLPDVVVEDVSDVPASGYMPIQVPPIYVATTSTEEVEVVTFGRTWVQEQLSQIGEENIQGTNYNPTKLQSSFSVFKPLTGIAKDAAIKGVKKLATKALSKTATGVAVKTGLKAAIASLGLPGGPVGVALTWLATEVFAKLGSKIKQFITKHKQDIAIAGLMLFGGGALMGSIPLMVLGGFIAIPSFIGGATLAGIGGSIFGLFGAIGGATLGAIAGPILFILLGFPVIVAFILFIINSGAYVVPPSISNLLKNQDNLYVEVAKIAEPSGPFENTDLPLKIKYTITVRARKDALTNIVFRHECKVVQENNSQNCTAPTEASPASISPTSPYVYTYEANYNATYKDALVTNTFTVTADSGENKNQTTVGGATITIGEPPAKCLKIDGAWPSGAKANLEDAKNKLISGHTNYVAKVCAEYPEPKGLLLRYNPGGDGKYWGWNHNEYIDFYQPGTKSKEDALYTLAHELGHSMAWRVKGVDPAYGAFSGIKTEAPYCFYSDTKSFNRDESMPEAIALHVLNGEMGCPVVSKAYPIHYRFLMKYIFN